VAGRVGELPVAGDERRAEQFGERDERRVIRGEVVAQLPDAVVERLVGVADEREVGEVDAGVLGALRADRAALHQPPQRVEQFGIDEVRAVEIAVFAEPFDEPSCRNTRHERLQHRGGVHDEHGAQSRSRPERTASTISS
jgi:hypothetical protein